MMTSRERVLRTLEFNSPDRIPVDLWVLPKARIIHGAAFDAVYERHEKDIVSVSGPFDLSYTPEYYQQGRFTDPWGSVWNNLQVGILGKVKQPVFTDYSRLEDYEPPIEQFLAEWEAARGSIAAQIAQARQAGRFVIGGWISLFERMQFLRGTENLYCDIALEEDELFQMIDIVMRFMHVYVEKWLEMDVDAVAFGDDWGTQISLLISMRIWRKLFKPLYKELIDRIKATGKKVLCETLAWIFGRPEYDISFHVNTDSADLIGTDTFINNEVRLRKGPIYQCAEFGGFGILDEINMAKNDAVSVLHATLDHRRRIDIPGYNRILLHPATRFIGTMNYGYAGTRELNEALVSRFMVIDMPEMDEDSVLFVLRQHFPDGEKSALKAFAGLFLDLQIKAYHGEISTKSLDLRGLVSAVKATKSGLSPIDAIQMGIINKSFDVFEKEIIEDVVSTRIPSSWTGKDIWG